MDARILVVWGPFLQTLFAQVHIQDAWTEVQHTVGGRISVADLIPTSDSLHGLVVVVMVVVSEI